MTKLQLALAAALALLVAPAFAQTDPVPGTQYPTPLNPNYKVGGAALLVPWSGDGVTTPYTVGPPTAAHPVPVTGSIGLSGNTPVQGAAATGATASGNPLMNGCRSESAEPTAVTNGQAQWQGCDLVGRTITSPYAPKEKWLHGSASTGSNTATVLIAAQGGSDGVTRIYLRTLRCGRTDSGSGATVITLNDAGSTQIVIPNSGAGGATNPPFDPPLAIAANTALTFTPGTSVTNHVCSADAYAGS